MEMHLEKKTPEQMVEAVFALDLDPIKFKLMDKKEGQGWSRAEADRHEIEYRRFLALMAKYPDASIVPDSDVDKFWHAHILDTMKYAEDCQYVFGYFVHHFPYFGMRDEDDAIDLEQAARETRRLYEKEFGTGVAQDANGNMDADSTASAAYCVRASAPSASYCVRAANPSPSYCVRAASSSALQEISVTAPKQTVLSKGRPKLPAAQVA